jgi:hypothetical protein
MLINTRLAGRAAGVAAAVVLLGLGLTATAEAAPAAPATSTCGSGELCLWGAQNFAGTKDAYSACRTVTNPFSGLSHGSVKDNQTGGVATVFYRKTGGTSTIHPGYEATDFDFSQYSKIKIC